MVYYTSQFLKHTKPGFSNKLLYFITIWARSTGETHEIRNIYALILCNLNFNLNNLILSGLANSCCWFRWMFGLIDMLSLWIYSSSIYHGVLCVISPAITQNSIVFNVIWHSQLEKWPYLIVSALERNLFMLLFMLYTIYLYTYFYGQPKFSLALWCLIVCSILPSFEAGNWCRGKYLYLMNWFN